MRQLTRISICCVLGLSASQTLWMLAGQSAHERTFPNRRKSYESNAGDSSSSDIEASWSVSESWETPPTTCFDKNSLPPPPPLDEGVNNSLRSFASLAFSCPKWYDVALFFCVSKVDGWDHVNLFDGKRPTLSTYWPFRPRHLWSRKQQIHHQPSIFLYKGTLPWLDTPCLRW